MAITYGAAVDATTPAIVDTNAANGLGGWSTGIGLTPADEASIGASRIGGAPGTDLKGDIGDGIGV